MDSSGTYDKYIVLANATSSARILYTQLLLDFQGE